MSSPKEPERKYTDAMLKEASPKEPKRKYTDAMLKEAYDDVKNKRMAKRKAARIHGIPEATLRFRLTCPREKEFKVGGPTIFSREKEEQLVSHCISMAQLGYRFSRRQIVDMAKSLCKVIGKNREPTKHWFYGFLKRFPELSTIRLEKSAVSNDKTANGVVLESYFGELRHILEQHEIINKPKQIWNVNELGISLEDGSLKIVSREEYSGVDGDKNEESVTASIFSAINVAGETIPPFVVYKGKRLSKDLKSGGLDGTIYRSSSNGWADSVLFLNFVKTHFLHQISVKPCLLLYDGRAAHISVNAIETVETSDVHLLVLPPPNKHCFQDLDLSTLRYFTPLKHSLESEVQKYLSDHPNNVVTREDISRLIGLAYKNAMTTSNIVSAFQKSGISTFDVSVSADTLAKGDMVSEENIEEHNDDSDINTEENVKGEQDVRV